MLYKEYIKVKPDFTPVFSVSDDRTKPDSWLGFFPHQSFTKILTATIDTLEKSSANKNRPIWMSGAYGTGKTFSSFVIKHILEDDLNKVEEYFAHEDLSPLWNRLAGIRSRGKILVVYQSSSSGINSQNKLLNTITEAVKRTLRENGYTYTGAASIYEKVLETLKDPESTFNFSAAFKKHKGHFMDYARPESVIKDLEELEDEERLDLLEKIVEVAEAESYNWSMSINDIIDWLRDVRVKNNLYAMVFIWDEFTEFFRNNVNNITGLQEIAQASDELSFYFFLITHSSAVQLITDDSQRKIIEARFKLCQITLEENTAFQLMGQALSIEPDLKNDWERNCAELLDLVKYGAISRIVTRDNNIKEVDIKKLFPLHPYSSYLLKLIAQNISSNQRTMFQFLCADYIISGETQTNFRWFIDTHSYGYGAYNFLTVDWLWDYFFRLENPDLDQTFKDAIIYYNNFEKFCQNDNQRRVLKVTLTLFALQGKSSGDRAAGVTSLLRSSQENICACFNGTPLENEVLQTLNFFNSKDIVRAMEGSDGIYYVMATAQINKERLQKCREQIQREKTFDVIIKDDSYGVAKKFKPSANYLKYRFKMQFISPTKFLQTNPDSLRPAVNQILLLYLFVADEDEQGKVNQTLQKIFDKFPERCIVADFSSTPFTKSRYEKFADNKAKELYFRDEPNQHEQLKLFAQEAAGVVQEWDNQLAVANIRVYTSTEKSVQISGERNFLNKLETVNQDFYPYGLETVTHNDKVFDPQGFGQKVAEYSLGMEKIAGSYGYLQNIEIPFKQIGGRDVGEYWLKNPSHTISKMKVIVEEIINQSFEKKSEVRFIDIWDALKNPPVGLTKCAGSVYILAALLKEYSNNVYYIRDINQNTPPLSDGKLANLVYNAVKGTPNVNQNFIVKQTQEHIDFCKITGEIFSLTTDKTNSIEDVAKNINIQLTKKKYPFWALKYYVDEEFADSNYLEFFSKFVSLIDEFVRPQTVNSRDKSKIVSDVYNLYQQNSFYLDELKNLVREDNFRQGMIYYIAQYKPAFTKITSKLKVEKAEYLARLTEKFSADSSYLWKIEDFNRQIDNFYLELQLVDAINQVLSEPQKNYREAQQALSTKLSRIKIPREIVEEFQPDLKNMLQIFDDIRKNSVKDFESAANEIKISSAQFKTFFDEQFAIFAEILRCYVDATLDDKTIDIFYDKTSSGTFYQSKEDFISAFKNQLQALRQNEKIQKFFDTWKNLTGTNSPADWSKRNEIPILCLFQDCLNEAQLYFSALNKTSSLTPEKIDAAIKFLQNDKLKRLQDKNFCEQSLVNYFGGEYVTVLDAESLKKILLKNLGSDVYSWQARKFNCKSQIENFAKENYRKNFVSKVREKVRSLTAAEAKKYLEELIEKDTLLGIRVLKNS
ncbi:MAG: hypothetical protein IKZ58_03510 [Selenomonadaceae bacterium]|nr:hypothetical protein [Selenomonadaceae bacterium]